MYFNFVSNDAMQGWCILVLYWETCIKSLYKYGARNTLILYISISPNTNCLKCSYWHSCANVNCMFAITLVLFILNAGFYILIVSSVAQSCAEDPCSSGCSTHLMLPWLPCLWLQPQKSHISESTQTLVPGLGQSFFYWYTGRTKRKD